MLVSINLELADRKTPVRKQHRGSRMSPQCQLNQLEIATTVNEKVKYRRSVRSMTPEKKISSQSTFSLLYHASKIVVAGSLVAGAVASQHQRHHIAPHRHPELPCSKPGTDLSPRAWAVVLCDRSCRRSFCGARSTSTVICMWMNDDARLFPYDGLHVARRRCIQLTPAEWAIQGRRLKNISRIVQMRI